MLAKFYMVKGTLRERHSWKAAFGRQRGPMVMQIRSVLCFGKKVVFPKHLPHKVHAFTEV